MSAEVSVRKPLGTIDPNLSSPRAVTPKKGSRIERETPKKVTQAASPVRKSQEITPRKRVNPVPVAKAIVKPSPKVPHSPTDDLVSPVTRSVNARFHRGPVRQSSRRISKATK